MKDELLFAFICGMMAMAGIVWLIKIVFGCVAC